MQCPNRLNLQGGAGRQVTLTPPFCTGPTLGSLKLIFFPLLAYSKEQLSSHPYPPSSPHSFS